MAQIEESIARYLAAMDTADRSEPEVAEAEEGPAARQDRGAEGADAAAQGDRGADAAPARPTALADRSRCPLDEDSRDGGIVGYNVQTAVDAKHHLIVAHEVITDGIDRDQLTPMAEQARAATGIDELTVVADRGYFKGEQIRQCDEAGHHTTGSQAADLKQQGRRSLRQAGLHLHRRTMMNTAALPDNGLSGALPRVENGLTLASLLALGLPQAVRSRRNARRATIGASRAGNTRRFSRRCSCGWIVQPEMMRVRRQTVEHPFGTIKHWMGWTHFLTKTLPRVRTEMSLHVLAYNLKRVMRILGIGEMLAAIRA